MFNKNEHTQVPLLNRSAPFIDDIIVSKEGIIKLLKVLNPSKALGPDERHLRVLKELAIELGPCLLIFFSNQLILMKSQKTGLLRNKFHFSEVHGSMNTTDPVQSKRDTRMNATGQVQSK